jgi:hypothetical protein
MDWDMDTLPLLRTTSSTTLTKSGNTLLEEDDDHQGETKKKVKIQSIMIHNRIEPMITICVPKTLT